MANIHETDGHSCTNRVPAGVLRDLLLKRNLAEQSKWLNDTTGDRSWAKHPTQNLPWMMNVQVEALEAQHDRS